MNSDKPDIDSLLDDIVLDLPAVSLSDTDTNKETTPELIEIIELKDNEIDPRLKLLSHSSRTTLHTCPRKYQLYRLSSQTISLNTEKETEQGVTFAYGTAVGVGIQSALESKSENEVYMDTFLSWDTDLLDNTPRHNKSFWTALFAVKKFMALRKEGYLDEYELVYYKGKPAVELSFQIILPNGFKYRGYVDGVLKHKLTGQIMVLECKTTSGNANSSQYKNSGQALGYSVILDILFPELSSYTVLYLVYESKTYEYKELPFEKTLLQRALWLQELLIDCQLVELYESYSTYPMHGESCFSFFKDCEYLSLCTLSTKNLTKPLTKDILEQIESDSNGYDFTVDFYKLVESQVEKGGI